MFLVYIDDSGDEHVRCFSALIIHESVWKECQAAIKTFRRSLKGSDGMYITKELHATDFIAGRGKVGTDVVSKARRCNIFKEVLSLAAALPEIRIMNAFTSRTNEKAVFERLINRINRTMAEWKSHAIIFHDEGKDYSYLIRRMAVYNPIPSKYGKWEDGNAIRNMPINRILEDIVYRDSRQSPFIQLADFCAYALFRNEVPSVSKAKYGINEAFQLLSPTFVVAAYSNDPKKSGIIRYP